MKPQMNPKMNTRQRWVWLLAVMILVAGVSLVWSAPQPVRADGGGWPTATNTVTQSPPPQPTLTSTLPSDFQVTQGAQVPLPDNAAPQAIDQQAAQAQQSATNDNSSLITIVIVLLVVGVIGTGVFWFLFIRKPK